MSDLVERLNKILQSNAGHGWAYFDTVTEAATEIITLRTALYDEKEGISAACNADTLEAKDKELAALRERLAVTEYKLGQAVGSVQPMIIARAETAENHVQRLQCALMFWMPSVTEAIEKETDNRCGDDAQLLAGYDGEFPSECWGDKTLERAETAERERDQAREALKQIKTVCEDNAEVEHKDLALRFVHNVAARAVIEQGEKS